MEQNYCVSTKRRSINAEPLRPMKAQRRQYGKITNLRKQMQQKKLHARYLVQVEVPVHPLLLSITNTIYLGTKNCTNTFARQRLYPKTIPVIFS